MTRTKDFTPSVLFPQTFMVSPVSIKIAPLRPIVPSRGAVTYGVAMEFASIIRPLVGHSPNDIRNTQYLRIISCPFSCNQGNVWSSLMLRPSVHQFWWTLLFPLSKISYNRSSCFPEGPPLSITQIISLLVFYLKNTNFLFQR